MLTSTQVHRYRGAQIQVNKCKSQQVHSVGGYQSSKALELVEPCSCSNPSGQIGAWWLHLPRSIHKVREGQQEVWAHASQSKFVEAQYPTPRIAWFITLFFLKFDSSEVNFILKSHICMFHQNHHYHHQKAIYWTFPPESFLKETLKNKSDAIKDASRISFHPHPHHPPFFYLEITPLSLPKINNRNGSLDFQWQI